LAPALCDTLAPAVPWQALSSPYHVSQCNNPGKCCLTEGTRQENTHSCHCLICCYCCRMLPCRGAKPLYRKQLTGTHTHGVTDAHCMKHTPTAACCCGSTCPDSTLWEILSPNTDQALKHPATASRATKSATHKQAQPGTHARTQTETKRGAPQLQACLPSNSDRAQEQPPAPAAHH
jgi:hypothetical protein